VPGLSGMNPDPEPSPSSPFAGNIPAVLAELNGAWGDRFDIGYDGWWTATRKDGTGDAHRELSPDGLIAAMRDAR
jgi:hypothetical protein